MNTSIATSFIVGGLLVISMITLNIRLSEFGANSVMDMNTQNRLQTLTELLENDFKRIGQDLPGATQPFITMQDQTIRFRADTYFDDNRPFSVVTWNFNPNKEYNASSNPNDFELTRTDNASNGPGSTDHTFPVSHFEVEYLTRSGDPVQNLPSNQNLIRQIRVHLVLESQEPSGTNANGNEVYARTMWTKTFSPPNLQFGTQ